MTTLRKTSPGNALCLGAILAGVLIYLGYALYIDWTIGGNSWKQGDWLIHGLGEPVRRGPFGSALLTLSDALGTSPLAVLLVFQGLVIALIFGVVGAAAIRLGAPVKLLVLLLSPAFVVLFWFNDPQGSVRKEMLAYLAFLPLILASMSGRGRHLALALSMVAYGLAVVAHEGNVFFLPFLWLAMWLVMPSHTPLAARLAILSVPGLLAFAAGVYAVLHPNVPDTRLICTHLMQRGLDLSICDGAIAYMETTPGEGRMHPGRLLSTHFRNFLLLYAACLVSFRLLFQGARHPDAWFAAVLVSGLAFVPMYLLAGDYGRWLNFHISALVLVLLVYFSERRPDWLYEAPRRLDVACVLALQLLVVGISHSPGELIDGFVVKLARGMASLL
ncbi:hypothetical protein [Hydrogenophaga sp.]|uniref:hypothetical protein n=1 Tax=Hydrogenophaga sp. TaxID=1904254 RepID=UPI003F6E8501